MPHASICFLFSLFFFHCVQTSMKLCTCDTFLFVCGCVCVCLFSVCCVQHQFNSNGSTNDCFFFIMFGYVFCFFCSKKSLLQVRVLARMIFFGCNNILFSRTHFRLILFCTLVCIFFRLDVCEHIVCFQIGKDLSRQGHFYGYFFFLLSSEDLVYFERPYFRRSDVYR